MDVAVHSARGINLGFQVVQRSVRGQTREGLEVLVSRSKLLRGTSLSWLLAARANDGLRRLKSWRHLELWAFGDETRRIF